MPNKRPDNTSPEASLSLIPLTAGACSILFGFLIQSPALLTIGALVIIGATVLSE